VFLLGALKVEVVAQMLADTAVVVPWLPTLVVGLILVVVMLIPILEAVVAVLD
jgi:hypothetical protein